MDFKLIINSIIIIFFIHIIILNINYNVVFGKEKFNNKTEDSINYLTSTDNNNDEDFKKKMLKYINQDIKEPKEPIIKTVEASNTFLNNDNEPNFESNVADISKFYNVTETFTDSKEQTEQRKPQVNADNWSYKNELPMNGGGMNGIIGFDSLESQFAIFNPNKNSTSELNNIPHNDLRKPIVYEN